MNKLILKITLLTALLLQLSCGFYSFKGSLDPHLKTVAIPLIDNRTAEFGVAEQMTDAFIDEFTKDNSLKIADIGSANVLINGAITRIDDRSGAVTSSETVQDIKIYITVSIKCMDQVKHQVMWEERLTQWGAYDPSGGPSAREDALAEAIEKLSQDVLNKTVSGW